MTDSLWLEDKYVNMMSPMLERFTKKDANLYNFRCPFCRDSQKSKFKARGYIYEIKGHLNFKCQNCGRGMSFQNFMKELDQRTHDEYRLELLKERGVERRGRPEAPPAKVAARGPADPTAELMAVSSFSADSPVKRYVDSRAIPPDQHWRLFYCNRFMEWVNTLVPGKFSEGQLRMDEPRLVIPFRDADGVTFAVTGRSFKKNSIKYMTVKFDEDADKIYGMDKVDPTKRVYVFEGPIDSMFIGNSIAFAGSSGRVPKFSDSVIILDNEPRNREIVRLNERFVAEGRVVCVWPVGFPHKDVNDAVMAGVKPEEVRQMIDDNAAAGLMATLKINEWKRS